mmetsp:Transcript_143187/g.399100  ORF Transcript_143187/g.399100 Transcript_143187/m.399100 type:complete len:205 (-) Transcript_143187:716-1330(-)
MPMCCKWPAFTNCSLAWSSLQSSCLHQLSAMADTLPTLSIGTETSPQWSRWDPPPAVLLASQHQCHPSAQRRLRQGGNGQCCCCSHCSWASRSTSARPACPQCSATSSCKARWVPWVAGHAWRTSSSAARGGGCCTWIRTSCSLRPSPVATVGARRLRVAAPTALPVLRPFATSQQCRSSQSSRSTRPSRLRFTAVARRISPSF